MNKQKNKRFTLIEMVVVIVIIAVLAGIATPIYFNHVKSARTNAAKMQIEILDQAVTTYRIDMKKLPNSLDDLVQNSTGSKKWKGPYIKSDIIPLDPWDNEYVFKKPGKHGDFDILSYGADGSEGGEDENADVGNWIIRNEQ